MRVSKEDRVYIAGFFDGEGCISSHINRNVKIIIAQKFPNILRHIYEVIKLGKIWECYSHTQSSLSYQLRVTSQKQVRNFIDLILPYTLIKKRQLEIAIKLMNRPKFRRGQGIRITKKEKIQRQLLRNKLSKLKKQDY